jgi:hypothetical protein
MLGLLAPIKRKGHGRPTDFLTIKGYYLRLVGVTILAL